MRVQNKNSIDKTFLGIVAALTLLGLATLLSASFSLAQRNFGNPYYFFVRQIFLGVGFGSILFWLGLKIKISFYKRWAPLILLGSVFLVILVLLPGIGVSIGGARRWLRLGPLSFQPSELLKLGFIIYLSSWLTSKKKEVSGYLSGFLPFMFITIFVGAFLIFEPDIGTLGVVAFSSLPLFFLGGGKGTQILIAIGLGIAALLFLIYLAPYRQSRLFVFLYPDREQQGDAYHINQALIAIGSGGMFGRGWGLSRQKFQYLPEPAGDAIFAVFAEELGFVGIFILFGLFFAFLVRGMMIASRSKDYFSQLLAAGITLLVIMQVIINVAAISGAFPLTGIPLPFMSNGGTAMAILLFEMGILLHISRRTTS